MQKIPIDIPIEKALQKFTTNALEKNHVRVSPCKLVVCAPTKTLRKKVST